MNFKSNFRKIFRTVTGTNDPSRTVSSPNLLILAPVMILLIAGLMMVYSASGPYSLKHYSDEYYLFSKQVICAIVGVVLMFIVSMIDYKILRKLAVPLFIVSTLMLVLVFVPHVGLKVNGASRWISIGSLRFQPSEIAKIALILMTAWYFSAIGEKINRFRFGILIPALGIGFVSFSVIAEPHISCSLIMAIVGVSLIFIAGADRKWLFVLLGIVIAGLVVVVFFTDYASERISAWLHPESDLYGKGWQAYQSLIAIGAGGFLGKGFGNSIQKESWLPEAHNDFIFSIFCEEFGFLGVILVLALFSLLIIEGYRTVKNAPDKFSKLVSSGIVLKIAVQLLLNIAVVTGSIPTTGVSFPFFSYGGTALIMQLFEIGILLSVSRFRAKAEDTESNKVEICA